MSCCNVADVSNSLAAQFLKPPHADIPLQQDSSPVLTAFSQHVRQQLNEAIQEILGTSGILSEDHIETSGVPKDSWQVRKTLTRIYSQRPLFPGNVDGKQAFAEESRWWAQSPRAKLVDKTQRLPS